MQKLESDRDHIDANFVTFYREAVQNNFKSQQAGHPIFDDVDYIRIVSPGGLNIIETPVRPEHKTRYPRLWANYQAATNGAMSIHGTPVEQWPLLSRGQAETLKGMQIMTVEQLAACSDEQSQRFHMVGPNLRQQAQDYLRAAAAATSGNADKERAEQAEARNAALQEQLASQAQQIAELNATMAKLAESMTVEKKKPGPKPKKSAPNPEPTPESVET